MEFAHGKIVLALEGGYNLESLGKSSLACVQVLLEDKQIHGSSETYPLESTRRVIRHTSGMALYNPNSLKFCMNWLRFLFSAQFLCHKYCIAPMLLIDKAHLFLVGLGTRETMRILAFT